MCSRGEREGDCSTPSPIGPMFRPLAGSQIKGMGVGRVEREVGIVSKGEWGESRGKLVVSKGEWGESRGKLVVSKGEWGESRGKLVVSRGEWEESRAGA